MLQMVVQSWDTAYIPEPDRDFSVCTTWGYREGTWYLLDLFSERLEFPVNGGVKPGHGAAQKCAGLTG